MYSLVIIDMQPIFPASGAKNIQSPILREIRLAKKHNYPIVVVEYRFLKNYSRTRKYITKELGKKFILVEKDRDDGSGALAPVLKGITKSKNVRLVGVNTHGCVKDTAEGLQWHGYNVKVVGDACNAEWSTDHQWALSKLTKNGVKVLRFKNEQ